MVTLSVTEAEYPEIKEVCCEILFVCAIFIFIGVFFKYFITTYIDSVGAIWLFDNTHQIYAAHRSTSPFNSGLRWGWKIEN